jgi:NIMA (never in mitosis gene a)-related kinase
MHYKTIKQIGRGGQGSVLLVQEQTTSHHDDTTTPHLYAMKRIVCQTLESLNMALTEVQNVLQLKHEHIVKCYKFFIERPENNDERLCIIYEYCEKGSLGDIILRQRSKKQSIQTQFILKWMLQICRAVAFLHSQNIIHRDMKPQNIFLTNVTRDVKLGDFGFAKGLQNSEDYTETILGSHYYMPPEIRSQLPYNRKIDVWGISAILLDLLLPKTIDFSYEYAINSKKILDQILERYDQTMVDIVQQIVVIDPDKRPDAEQAVELFEKAYIQMLDTAQSTVQLDVIDSTDIESPILIENHSRLSHSDNNEIHVLKKELKRLTLRCMELERDNQKKDEDVYFLKEQLREYHEEDVYSPNSSDSSKSNSFKLRNLLKKQQDSELIPAKEILNRKDTDIFGSFYTLSFATWKSKELNQEIPVALVSLNLLCIKQLTVINRNHCTRRKI